MMKTRLILASALLLFPVLATAQSASLVDWQVEKQANQNKVILLDGRDKSAEEKRAAVDSLRRAITTFYYDQFRHSQDPGMPYFLFLSKDNNIAMGLGGVVRMRGWFDWDGAIGSPAFAPFLIPMHPDPTKMRALDFTPAGTCLFFRVMGDSKVVGPYQLYIEAGFSGYNYRDLKLKKAFATIGDFTVGLASSTFSDPAATPSTVDSQGPNSKVSQTTVLVRYQHTIKDKWVFAVSAENPDYGVDELDQYTKKVNKWMPDFAAFAQYQWAPGQHVRLGGILRTLSYRNLVEHKNHTVMGWGAQLSAVGHPIPQLTLYGNVSIGHGYSSLNADLACGNYDLVNDLGRPGKMYAPRSVCWGAGIQYNILPNLFCTVMASQTRYLPAHGIQPDEYKYGWFGAANVFWDITPRIQVAAEFDYGFRKDFSGLHRSARRIGALCQFSF